MRSLSLSNTNSFLTLYHRIQTLHMYMCSQWCARVTYDNRQAIYTLDLLREMYGNDRVHVYLGKR